MPILPGAGRLVPTGSPWDSVRAGHPQVPFDQRHNTLDDLEPIWR
jgi:hypothetical protein